MDKLYLVVCFVTITYIGDIGCSHQETGGYGLQWTYLKSYGGPNEWLGLPGIEHNECGGLRQSPIRIYTKSAIATSRRLKFINHNHYYHHSLLYNNGHNVNLTLGVYEPQPQLQVSLGDGRLETYNFDSIHFHFGQQSDHGSEHVVNGVRYAMEMHAVYYDARFRTYSQAYAARAGLAIVAVLYHVDPSEEDNMRISTIANSIPYVMEAGSSARIGVFLADLFPVDKRTFYSYEGSLTTPPCAQTPTWYILNQLCSVSESQMEQFRKLKKALTRYEHPLWAREPVADNVRPTQNLNGRTVLRHPAILPI